MAKFCTKCGKPLKDGKPCDCEKESVSNDNVVGDYLDILKGMFKNPSKVLKVIKAVISKFPLNIK